MRHPHQKQLVANTAKTRNYTSDGRPIGPEHARERKMKSARKSARMPKDVLVETRQEVDRVKGLKTSLENIILSRGRRLYG